MNNLDLFLNEIQNIESQITPFNYALYYELYPDLKQQKITTFLALYQHYIKYGKAENRISNYYDFYQQYPGFDYNFYINSNRELINAIQIKYSSKIEGVSEVFKEHYALVHYYLFGRFQNKLINPNSLLTTDINPLDLPTRLSFLSPPQLGNVILANICYQEYLNSNSVTISPITDSLLVESNIGSVLFVDNTYPLNVAYSNNLRIIEGNVYINTANIKEINSDINIKGNVDITGSINSNCIINNNITTNYNYTNSFVYQDTFSIEGNLDISTELSLNDFIELNYSGNVQIIDNKIKCNLIQFDLIEVNNFTIEFNLIVDDISTETQTIFECENFQINLNLFNQIEIVDGNDKYTNSTQLLINTDYFILVTNTKLIVNDNEINFNFDKIKMNNCILGKNIQVELLLSNFKITDTKNNILLTNIINGNLVLTSYSKIVKINNTGVYSNSGYFKNLINKNANIINLNSQLINVNEIVSNISNFTEINSELINCQNLNINSVSFKNNEINLDNLNSNTANMLYANITNLNSEVIISKTLINGNLIIENNCINNLIYFDNNVTINSNLIVSNDTSLTGNVFINEVSSRLFVNNDICNNYGYLYGSTLLLKWDYFDIPVYNIFNFGLCEPGNNTGYSGSQFSSGFAIQNNPIINNSARLILRCQDISYNYTGSIGSKTIEMKVCQLRYQGNTSFTSINENISSTYIDITESFFCHTESAQGYFTVVSPFFNLVNLDVPTLGLRVVSMTNNGTHMRLGPVYLQLK